MTEHNHRRGTSRKRKPILQEVTGTWHHPDKGPCEFTDLVPNVKLHNGYRPRNRKVYGNIDKSMHGWGRESLLADAIFGASIGNDFNKGNRGMAKAVRGAKKFVRSRFRFHENAATRKLAYSPEADDTTCEGVVHEGAKLLAQLR